MTTADLKSGVYRSVKEESPWNSYDITVMLSVGKKNLSLFLLSDNSHYTPGQIEMLFKKSKKVNIPFCGSKHAIRVWSDHDFTIYPFQSGVPFWFRLCESEKSS